LIIKNRLGGMIAMGLASYHVLSIFTKNSAKQITMKEIAGVVYRNVGPCPVEGGSVRLPVVYAFKKSSRL
jgi:hypothetical protein